MTLLFLSILLAGAQEGPSSRTVFTASTDDSFRAAGGRDDGGGDVDVLQTKLSFEALHLSEYRNFYRFSAAAERIWYEFEGSNELEDAVALRTDASWVHVFDETWTGAVYGGLKLEYEPGAPVRDALAGAAGIGGWARVSEPLSLGLLLHFRFHIEDTPQIWPLPYIEWKIDDRLRLHTGQKAGFGYTLTYGFDDPREDGSFEWAGDLRTRFQTRRMRMDGDGFNPDGILEDLRFTIDVLVRYEPVPGLSLGVYAGVEAWQAYEIEDPRGVRVRNFNTYPKPVFGVSVYWKF